ncbi:MAG: haloacid dehalogenase type II [Proteobacteria bacterium]|nr:haloacid dehalogenase type II [Pseudomonadota bacterium]
MVDLATLRNDIKVLAFDQYGTVVDIQGGLVEFVTPFLAAKAWSGKPDQFVTWWRRTHFENSMIDALCDRGHTPYREIGRRAVSHTMDRAGIVYSDDEARMLVAAIERLRPFPEVPAALARLATRFRLAIHSNGDADMLEAAKPYLGHRFDCTISVEDAGYFKPHRHTYESAARRLGVAPHEVLHVANHAFDCIGACAAGMRAAFIDRRGRPYGQTPHQAHVTAKSMTELADLLLA